MTTAKTIDTGARLAQLEERIALAKRNLARLGWTQAALEELCAPKLLCGSSPRMKAVK